MDFVAAVASSGSAWLRAGLRGNGAFSLNFVPTSCRYSNRFDLALGPPWHARSQRREKAPLPRRPLECAKVKDYWLRLGDSSVGRGMMDVAAIAPRALGLCRDRDFLASIWGFCGWARNDGCGVAGGRWSDQAAAVVDWGGLAAVNWRSPFSPVSMVMVAPGVKSPVRSWRASGFSI